MNLFETFTSKENLKKAFLYLENEIEETSLPLDPIWRPALSAIANLGDEFFEALQQYLREDKYQPDKADFIYAQKDNLGVRPICVFSVVDRIIYQAILNPLVLGNAIDKKLCSSCLGNRVLGKEKYLKPYKNQWAKFCDKQTEAYKNGFMWRAEFDIQTYYEAIHIDSLTDILKSNFNIDDERLLNIVSSQLKSWSENSTKCGIPQGANASHILANAYLSPLDLLVDDLQPNGEFEFFRYADDMVIMATSAEKINQISEKMVVFLRKLNLKINEKTRLIKLRDTKSIEENKFYSPYGQLNETSLQKVVKISHRLPTIFRRIKKGDEVKKSDISGLKYYLKARAGLTKPDVLDNLICLIPKKPSLIYLICRYLGTYFSDRTIFFSDFFDVPVMADKKFVQSRYERVWKIYCNSSLTQWTKFWLLKVLSSAVIAENHEGVQSELKRIIADPKTGFLGSLAFFYKAYTKESDIPSDLGFKSDDIRRRVRNARTETEKAIFYYFLIYLKGIEEDGVIEEILNEAIQSTSPEIQLMGLFVAKKLSLEPKKEKVGEFCRIFYKLPSPEKQTTQKQSDELLTDEGKIAEDKLAPLFGIPPPETNAISGLTEVVKEGLEGIEQAIIRSKKEDSIPRFPYKIPRGTRWENFIIKFINDEEVEIKVGKHELKTNFKEMGFQGKGKIANPDLQWTLLKTLARLNGEISIKDKEAKDEYKHQISSLSRKLQQYFSIDYDPFYPYHSAEGKEKGSYRIKIILVPPENDEEMVKQDNGDLGIEEQYKKETEGF